MRLLRFLLRFLGVFGVLGVAACAGPSQVRRPDGGAGTVEATPALATPPVPVATPEPASAPAQAPVERPAPVQGWDAAYDAHVRAEVEKVPALVELPASRMAALCPRWARMDRAARLQFYADLLYAIAGPESRWNRRAMFNETGILDARTRRQAIDPVTGAPIVSEGLLQLSYQDMTHYPEEGGLGCRFDWEKDRSAFEEDLRAGAGRVSFESAHPERSILDPYVQLTCGVHVLDVRLRQEPTVEFRVAAGRYWSTMRPRTKRHAKVVQGLQERKSACFGP